MSTKTRDLTVLVYLDGRNRLATSSAKALRELEAAGGSSDRVDVVVQSTVEPTLFERLRGIRPQATRRIHLAEGGARVVQQYSHCQPLNTRTLRDFLAWGMKAYPARRYMVLLKTHGAGFAGESVGVPLSATQLKAALQGARSETGGDIGVLALDACSTQQLELAYELRDQARVLTGSQEDTLASNYPYYELLTALRQASDLEPEEIGKLIVDANRAPSLQGPGLTSQSALRLAQVSDLAARMRALRQAILDCNVSPSLLYTRMLRTPSQEPDDTLRLQYNFRDLGGFLAGVGEDERFPKEVREAADLAFQALEASLLTRYASPGSTRRKAPTGVSAVLPWRDLEGPLQKDYLALDYTRDTGWDRVLQQVFHTREPAPESPPRSGADLGWPVQLAKLPLWHYKKYVSGHLGVACPYTPSCSQYAREAIERHGLLKGSWLGAVRLLSCNQHTHGGSDPVPGSQRSDPGADGSAGYLVAPPRHEEAGWLRSQARKAVIIGAGLAGACLGAIAGALALLPAGLLAGGFFGALAGADRVDAFTARFYHGRLEEQREKLVGKVPEAESLAANHAEAAAQGMLRIARAAGQSALYVHDRLLEFSHSPRLAAGLGATVGA
ncbi:MAG: membrane protein insertion efficiency factor YidD, partial [Candidatus Eremiobacterota bacterium]